MNRLRREERGFTLPELLITCIIAMTVSLAAFSLIDFVMRRSVRSGPRRDHPARPHRDGPDDPPAALAGLRLAQRRDAGDGRLALAVRRLADPSVTLFADFTQRVDGRRADAAHTSPSRLTRAAGGTIVETATPGAWAGDRVTFARARRRRGRSCRTSSSQVLGQRVPVGGDPAPLLRYYRFPNETEIAALPRTRRRCRRSRWASDAADPGGARAGREDHDRVPRAARQEQGLPDDKGSQVLQNDIYVRTVGPQRRDPEHHMRNHMTRLNARAERGFSMFIVIMAMFVTSMFVAAAFAAANGDLPCPVATRAQVGLRGRRGRPELLPQPAPAGSGLLDQVRDGPRAQRREPTRSTSCGTASAPTPATGARSRARRPVHDRADRDTPRAHDGCDPAKQQSFVDMATGTFKIRRTGRPSRTRRRTRSIVATFRRDSFLNFVYFTDYENRDPQAESTTDRARQQTTTARTGTAPRAPARAARDPVRRRRRDQRAAAHQRREPLHLRLAGVRAHEEPGRHRRPETDMVEVSRGRRPGTSPTRTARLRRQADDQHAERPTVQANAKTLDLPRVQHGSSQTIAANGGKAYTGKTIIRLSGHGDGRHQLNARRHRRDHDRRRLADQRRALRREQRRLQRRDPDRRPTTTSRHGCGNVYVSGTYAKPLTIAAANDIIIRPTIGAKLGQRSTDAEHQAGDGNDATLGLIANNFVRVGHKANRGTASATATPTQEPAINNVRSTPRSCRCSTRSSSTTTTAASSGTLTVNGAIVQKYRGPVGTGSRHRSPPAS